MDSPSTPGPGPSDPGPLKPLLLLVALGVLGLGGAYVHTRMNPPAPVRPVADAAKAKAGKADKTEKAGKARKPRTAAAGAPEADSAARQAAADSVARAAAALKDTGWAPFSRTHQDRGFNHWVEWDSPDSETLKARARDLAQGYPQEKGRLYMTEGFAEAVPGRRSKKRLVRFHPDIDLPDSMRMVGDSVPFAKVREWYAFDPLEEWTVHSPSGSRPFRPAWFRLAPEAGAADSLHTLWAYADPGALLIWPTVASGSALGNRYASRRSLALGGVDTVIDRTGFEAITGGRVDSVRLFSIPGKSWQLAEVYAWRTAKGGAPGVPDRPGRLGVHVFLVDPADRASPRVAFLAHDFDQRPCIRDKDTRFRGVLDVNGDGRLEILLGPSPSLLFFEDGQILNFHQEYEPPCRP